MSRNLCNGAACAFCAGSVAKTGPTRAITAEDCGVYFPEYEGMLVADAACVDCEAPYLAWLDGRTCRPRHAHGLLFQYPTPCSDENGELEIRDLSHKHSFNDEPGVGDYPKWKMVRVREPWPKCPECGEPMAAYGERCSRWWEHTSP